jgi:N6-L-threonylcarbamoyladenine synthase
MKTAVLNHLNRLDGVPDEVQLGQIAAAFQLATVDVLTQKTLRAAEAEGLTRIVVAGGVACNSGLRRKFAELAEINGLEVHFPSPILCADNAAMLAVAGDYYLGKGYRSALDLNAVSSWPLEQAGVFNG